MFSNWVIHMIFAGYVAIFVLEYISTKNFGLLNSDIKISDIRFWAKMLISDNFGQKFRTKLCILGIFRT